MKVSSPKTSLRIPETLALEGAILALEQVSHDLVICSNFPKKSWATSERTFFSWIAQLTCDHASSGVSKVELVIEAHHELSEVQGTKFPRWRFFLSSSFVSIFAASSGYRGWLGASNLVRWNWFLDILLGNCLGRFRLMRKFRCWHLEFLLTFFVRIWMMFTITWFFGLKAIHRFPTGSCKIHNVKNWMIGCTDC